MDKYMNKQQLASTIWESANKMRSKIEANEYKDYILGFLFYKYLSDQELKFLKETGFSEEEIKGLVEDFEKKDESDAKYIQENLGYFIAYENLFTTWLEKKDEFDVSNVRDALSAFNRLISDTHKKVFEKIFDTLQIGLSKLGDTSKAQTKSILALIKLIKKIPTDEKHDYDILGFVYEYLISHFAANAGKKAGEFYTPYEVSLLMSEIIANHLKYKKNIRIYDPTSGSGSLLINIGKSVKKYNIDSNITYYAQELKENTYNLTRMNLVMRGIKPDNIITRNADTLEKDWPYFEENDKENTYKALQVEAVVSNPPYSQMWNSENRSQDPRYSDYGVAPKSKADYAFLLHDLYHVTQDGIMTIVLPHGVLFRGGEEGNIRKNLIENNNIDAIIGLPSNIFFGTGIPTIIMVLKKKRDNTDVLMIDASKGFVKEGKNNKLRASDIKKIVDTIIKRENVDKFSRIISREEIRKNDYNLYISKYVDSINEEETYDMYASMFGGIPASDVNKLNNYWNIFPSLKEAIFVNKNNSYLNLKINNIYDIINNNEEVLEFKRNFKSTFKDFTDYLKLEWIENIENIDIIKTETIVTEEIFRRLKNIPLVDKYEVYQILNDNWTKILPDLERIKLDGINITKQVEANIVVKKKKGSDEEVEIQEGWRGCILPFELVQQEILKEKYTLLKNKEKRRLEISGKYEEIIETMNEDEKETEVLNEENTAFNSKEVTKKIKELKKDINTLESKIFLEKLVQYEILSKEEKELKKELKREIKELELLTKEVIENLEEDVIMKLLEKKWINNLVDIIFKLPEKIIESLVREIEKIQKKYEVTYFELEEEIIKTASILANIIDELEADEFDMEGLSEFSLLLKGE